MNRDTQKLVGVLLVLFRMTGGRLPLMALCVVVGVLVLWLAPALLPDLQPAAPTPNTQSDSPAGQPQTTYKPAGADNPSLGVAELLEPLGGRRYRSPAGLVYGPGSAHGHRFDHVMAHGEDEPDRVGQHGVFDPGDPRTVIATIDEAYSQALADRDTETERDDRRTIYAVDLRRPVGYIGGQSGARKGHPTARRVKLVVEGERLITAFPIQP